MESLILYTVLHNVHNSLQNLYFEVEFIFFLNFKMFIVSSVARYCSIVPQQDILFYFILFHFVCI